jgi:amidophosphoribosyltransferase
MSAGLLGIYSFGGTAELWPLVFYGLKAMANRGDSAEAYVYDGGGLRRVEVDLYRVSRGRQMRLRRHLRGAH